MADDKNQAEHDANELRALSEVRAALEAVERQQDGAARERRRLRDRLDGLLDALREDALLLTFDLERDLVGANGAVGEHFGVEPRELVDAFEDFADEETIDALDEANRAVLAQNGPPASVSDGFLHGGDEELAITFVHLRRTDEHGETVGTEVIGLVAPVAEPEEEAQEEAADPFDNLLEHIGRRLLDDAGEAAVARAVKTFGDFLLADRVVVNRYDDKARRFSTISSWLRGSTRPLDREARGISISELPWAYSALGAGEAVVISENAGLPPDAGPEVKLYARGDVKSSLLVPMVRRDNLFGFVSIQASENERDWGESDIDRARKFVMLLSAALARDEAEARARATREELEGATKAAAEAESKATQAVAEAEEKAKKEVAQVEENAKKDIAEAEKKAKEEVTAAQGKLEELKKEADDLRKRLSDLERDADRLREAEKTAKAAVEETRRELEAARREHEEAQAQVESLRQEADDARSAEKRVREEADRARRGAEDASADVTSLRKEIEDLREQLQEALDEAADLHAAADARNAASAARAANAARVASFGARDQRDDDYFDDDTADEADDRNRFDDRDDDFESDDERAEGVAAADSYKASPDFAADDDDAGSEPFERFGFDPDATLEMEPLRWAREQARAAAEESIGEDDDDSLALDSADAGDDVDAAASDLDSLLEPTQSSAAETSARWKDDKTSWEDRTDEVDLPAFLRPADEDDADDHDHDSWKPMDRDVEAARQVARHAAGRDDADDDEADAARSEDFDDDERDSDRFRVLGRDDRDVDDDFEIDYDFSGDFSDDDRDDEDDDAEADDRSGPAVLPDRAERTGELSAFGRRAEVERTGELDAFRPRGNGRAAPAGDEIRELAGIDVKAGLQDVGGNVQLYRSLLNKFRNDYIGAANKISSAVDKGNIEVAHLLLHAVKGVAGVLGAVRVRDTADDLETRLIGGDDDATRRAVDSFRVALDQALDSIGRMDEEPAAERSEAAVDSPGALPASNGGRSLDGHVSDPMVLRSYLSGLRQHLMGEKIRQCQLVMREITARTWPPDYDEHVAELAELVEAGEFGEAREVYDRLMQQFRAR